MRPASASPDDGTTSIVAAPQLTVIRFQLPLVAKS